MGIYIRIGISKAITKAEWESVYAETLLLIREFPLAEVQSVPIGGVDTICLTRTRERDVFDDWGNRGSRLGWRATGDYIEMKKAEEFCLSCDIVAQIFGNEPSICEKFICEVMDEKLHIKNKDCKDMLDINQEAFRQYTENSTDMPSYFIPRSIKVDRYIPLQEIRDILTERFDGVCDVNHYINAYIENEDLLRKKIIENFMPTGDSKIGEPEKDRIQNPCDISGPSMEPRIEGIRKLRDAYDILGCEELLFYKRGDRVYPELEEGLKRNYKFYHDTIEEETYHRLLREAPIKRYEFLIENNEIRHALHIFGIARLK